MIHRLDSIIPRRCGTATPARKLDTLLDRQVTGMPTPIVADAVKGTSDGGEADELARFLADARNVLQRADARRLPQHDDDKQMIWETIMMQAGNSSANGTRPSWAFGRAGGARRRNAPQTWHWQSAVSQTLVVAVLLVGLGFGIWQTWGSGNGDGDTPSQIAALLPSTATPMVTDRIVLPTAADCTVQPLTVDQVLAPINDPLSVWDDVDLGKEPDFSGSGIEAVSPDYVGPPNAKVLEQVSSLQREWNACAIAGSWMQLFALMDPAEMKRIVETYVFPEYLSEDEGRAIIETLAATGKTPDGITARGYFGGTLSFVHPDAAKSLQYLRGIVVPALVEYDTDGKYLRMDDLPLPGMSASFSYVWDGSQSKWIMYSVNGVLG
jgi:hypothetical protein